jgi:WD40 repeat protein
VKIYTLNDKTQNYDEKELKVHACIIRCILYIPKFDYLVTGSSDKTIKVISLANQQQHKTLEGHSYVISSLLLLSNDRFASGGFTEIKIWSIKENTNIDCIKHMNANEIFSHCFISLHSLRNEFFVCRASNEFSIWDANNYELIKIYKEESYIETLIVTRSHDIITSTKNMNINIWKIST